MDHEQLRQMAFRALNRAKHLGEDVEMSIFDREMDEWYASFLVECDPEQRKEIEYHDKINQMLKGS